MLKKYLLSVLILSIYGVYALFGGLGSMVSGAMNKGMAAIPGANRAPGPMGGMVRGANPMGAPMLGSSPMGRGAPGPVPGGPMAGRPMPLPRAMGAGAPGGSMPPSPMGGPQAPNRAGGMMGLARQAMSRLNPMASAPRPVGNNMMPGQQQGPGTMMNNMAAPQRPNMPPPMPNPAMMGNSAGMMGGMPGSNVQMTPQGGNFNQQQMTQQPEMNMMQGGQNTMMQDQQQMQVPMTQDPSTMTMNDQQNMQGFNDGSNMMAGQF